MLGFTFTVKKSQANSCQLRTNHSAVPPKFIYMHSLQYAGQAGYIAFLITAESPVKSTKKHLLSFSSLLKGYFHIPDTKIFTSHLLSILSRSICTPPRPRIVTILLTIVTNYFPSVKKKIAIHYSTSYPSGYSLPYGKSDPNVPNP